MSSAGLQNESLGSGTLWTSAPGDDVQLSDHIKNFLAEHPEAQEALSKPVLTVPEEDDSHPIADYFISTSHNTYLLHNQLYGQSSADSYTHVLSRHARCIEIDAWDSSSQGSPEVIVVHGHTLVKSIPFREVVEAIGAAVDADPQGWPVWVAIENHTAHEGQREMVRIFEEVWGDKLVSRELPGVGQVTPRDLRGKILLEIEWYPPAAEGDEPKPLGIFNEMHHEVKKMVKEVDPGLDPKVLPELSALGVYAKSVKPGKDFLTKQSEEPDYYLLNISESGAGELIPKALAGLVANNGKHLMRVYPEGLRVDSENLVPTRFWRAGAHMPALNWQTFDKGMQVNEGFYAGTRGWVLKPPSLRSDAGGREKRKGQVYLSLQVVAGSGLPRPSGLKEGEPFQLGLKAEIMHSSGDVIKRTKEVPASASGGVGAEAVWNERLEWTWEDEELVHFRLILVHKKWDGETDLGAFSAQVDGLQQGWRLVSLLDMRGAPTGGWVLVRVDLARE
ncbi:PLC-like phosphodiesterase [Calocera viscosa TUFC12733]|uniref:Phosphoinositide phospholipase C n=1 Tax=Calocera viscosa (strain TUFC12733) TaxID=1330018 RepID=A0A167N1Q6_CALVF|nr:PLC-like phosphodiesterase [Calocera viscosa TUFC12733]